MFRQFPTHGSSTTFKRQKGGRLLGYQRTKSSPITSVLADMYLPIPVNTTAGYLQVWTGSAWELKPMKVWNGSSWVIKPVKRWTGTNWKIVH